MKKMQTVFQANVGLGAFKGNQTSNQLQMGTILQISRNSNLLEMEGAQKKKNSSKLWFHIQLRNQQESLPWLIVISGRKMQDDTIPFTQQSSK